MTKKKNVMFMFKPIEDLWIIQENGVVLFKQVAEEKVDTQLFGSFMSAIDMFASKLDERGLNSFQFGDKKFTIIKKRNLFVIGTHEPKLSPKKALRVLEGILDKFISIFKVELESPCTYNIARFEGFQDNLANATTSKAVSQLKACLW